MDIRVRMLSMAVVLAVLANVISCSVEENPLRPYDGDRPLILLNVTQNFTPDVQWVGGRVAAVGVNRGDKAGLDETLVWIRRSSDDDIGSYVKVGPGGDPSFVTSVGGTPTEALADGQQYTFWIATAEAMAANLASGAVNGHSFTDTTVTINTVLRGQLGGERIAGTTTPRASMRMVRNETLMEDQFILEWTPADFPVRQIAVRQATTGGWTDLIWHVVLPDDVADNITSPVILGSVPEGAQEAIAWPSGGFELGKVYTIWMTNQEWVPNTFGISARGYWWFRMFALTN
jgi:hypothetical protein